MKTLEHYLKTQWEKGCIDFVLKCFNDGASFYVVPDNYDRAKKTETPQFKAEGNLLISLDEEEYMGFRIGQKVMIVPGVGEEFPTLINQKIVGKVGTVDNVKRLLGIEICYVQFPEGILQKLPAALMAKVSEESKR